jgi:hypothetical protein
MARPTYKSFVRKCGQPPKREALSIGGDGPYFRDGHMNREPHGLVTEGRPETPAAERREVHVYHYGKDQTR